MFSKHLNSKFTEILISATHGLFNCITLTMKGKMPKNNYKWDIHLLSKWDGSLLIIFDGVVVGSEVWLLTIQDYWSDDGFSTFPT
jgi:hypothetical protein